MGVDVISYGMGCGVFIFFLCGVRFCGDDVRGYMEDVFVGIV